MSANANEYEYEYEPGSPSQNEETTSGFWNTTPVQSNAQSTKNPSSSNLQRNTFAEQMSTSFDNLTWTDEGNILK